VRRGNSRKPMVSGWVMAVLRVIGRMLPRVCQLAKPP
jgi:hypothetical protein